MRQIGVSTQNILLVENISKYLCLQWNKNNSIVRLKHYLYSCRSPVCYENNNFTCAYVKDKNRSYGHPPPVNTGRIDTNGKFSFTYGRIEIYATLPNGDWLFPCKCINISNIWNMNYVFLYMQILCLYPTNSIVLCGNNFA